MYNAGWLPSGSNNFSIGAGWGQSVFCFESNGAVYYNYGSPVLWPPSPQTSTMAVPSSRIVTMVHPSIVHNNIPAPSLQNSLLYGQPLTLQPDQNVCVLNAQFMETLYCNRQEGVDGVFHGQQITVQRQPVIFMGLPGAGLWCISRAGFGVGEWF